MRVTLQPEGLSSSTFGQPCLQVPALSGKHKRRHARQLLCGLLHGRLFGVLGLLVGFQFPPALQRDSTLGSCTFLIGLEKYPSQLPG